MKLLVTIPLCDYEPITSSVWNRSLEHTIVSRCLGSFERNIHTPLDLVILADRCTDGFVRMAEKTLRRFKPVVIDNSKVGYGLERTSMAEKYRHVLNQFLKTIELSRQHDLFYFCEQDYLFKKDALDHALAAFEEIPGVNLLSLFDHPDRHIPSKEPELGRQRYFPTRLSTWKNVSSINANWLWRTSFVKERYGWLLGKCLDGALDYRISNGLYREGELVLSPVKSLIQHFQLYGNGQSPTFGFSPDIALMKPVGKLLALPRRLAAYAAARKGAAS